MKLNISMDVKKKLFLPCLTGLAGILATLNIWYFFDPSSWMAPITGILCSILIALLLYLRQLHSHYKQLLKQANIDFDKEMGERLNAEETKQKLQRALLQGQKLQAIGTLAGGIAHDFNNLLYAIIGYVDMACEDIDKSSLTYKNLCKVLEAAHRGRDLISRILTFSRRHHHDLKSICIKESIEGVLSLLKPTIPSSVMLDFEVNMTSGCKILGDQTQLHQVLVNIINNAVDAMDGEGKITISLNRIPAQDPTLEQFSKTLNTPYCKIDIIDNGHGMEAATVERIFEPFFTTKEVGKGTGLGLATVHAIIEEHEGQITVKSQPGHGSTFTILLPEQII